MKFTILTLFKEVFDDYLNSSIIKKAIQNKLIEVEIIDIRNYSKLKNKQVDDYQYGGGPGMVLMLEPIVDAIRQNSSHLTKKILLSPSGKTLNQNWINDLVKNEHILLICGHYEGVDERIKHYIDDSISIGDYVLTGGELPALVVLDAISRLVSDVINKESLVDESFNNNLLDHPVYTKPANFEGYKVPSILLSGNHQKIKAFRLEQRELVTQKKRPDLYKEYLAKKGD